MVKIIILVLAVLFVCKYGDVKGNPLSNYEQSLETETRQEKRTFRLDSKEQPRFYYSWSLPSLPSFSISSLFKDDDDDMTILKKKISTLEKSHKEILDLFKQLTTRSRTTTCDDKSSSPQSSNKDQAQKDPKNARKIIKSKGNDIVDDRPGYNGGNTTKDQTQSDSTTIKGDSRNAAAPSTNVDKGTVPQTKVNEKETPTTSKNDGAQTDAPVNETGHEKTTIKDNETGGSTEKQEKVENSNVAEELGKSEIDKSVEEYQKLGKPENVTAESIGRTIREANEENGVERQNGCEIGERE